MGALTKGEITLYPFPFTDLSQRKLRPCLVLSDEMQEDILLCQITSRVFKDKYCVPLAEHGLRVKSFVRCNMLFTANKHLARRSVGSISSREHEAVREKIRALIA